MKRILLSALVVLFVSGGMYAMDDDSRQAGHPVNSIYGGSGQVTFMEVDAWLRAGIDSFFSEGEYEVRVDRDGYPPALFLGYDRMLGEHISVGAMCEYQRLRILYTYYDGREREEVTDWHFLLARMKWYWGWDIVRGYHGVGLGCGWRKRRSVDEAGEKSSEERIIPGIQITIFGLEIAPIRNVSIYGDVGLGDQGMLNFGAAFRF